MPQKMKVCNNELMGNVIKQMYVNKEGENVQAFENIKGEMWQ